jgi:hypothetical protein
MMDTYTIIQVIEFVLTGTTVVLEMTESIKTPKKDFKQPLITEIRCNVALLDDFFKAMPKKKTREDLNGIVSKLKKESYDKLLSEYADIKWSFGKKKTKHKNEPLYESIHIFYYKIGELKQLIDSQNVRPNIRIKNICARGHSILDTMDKKRLEKQKSKKPHNRSIK